MSVYYFEDFTVGQQFETATHTTTEAEALAFANRYDPQPHHTDAMAAKASLFGALVLSGWETASIVMGLKLRHTPLGQVATGLVGIGIDNMRWPKAVEPGDVLRATITIVVARPSTSRPDKGVVKYKIEAFNQRDELVMEMEVAVLMPRRKS